MRRRWGRAFTMVELLVTMAVIALLLGLLLPTLRGVREHTGETSCASNLKQLGAATLAYLAAWDDHLPQVTGTDPFTGEQVVIGSLFGGKRGTLPYYDIDQYGADERPLNAFLGSGVHFSAPVVAGVYVEEDMPLFHCPLDRGQPGAGGIPAAKTLYDLVGTSYALNDHTLDNNDCWTLIPGWTPPCAVPGVEPVPGGRMPAVLDPAKTWMIGDQPIFNFEADPATNPTGDHKQRWHFNKVQVNLCFVDGHVGQGIEVPKSSDGDGDGRIDQNTTKRYTFLPRPDWLEPDALGSNCSVCSLSAP